MRGWSAAKIQSSDSLWRTLERPWESLAALQTKYRKYSINLWQVHFGDTVCVKFAAFIHPPCCVYVCAHTFRWQDNIVLSLQSELCVHVQTGLTFNYVTSFTGNKLQTAAFSLIFACWVEITIYSVSRQRRHTILWDKNVVMLYNCKCLVFSGFFNKTQDSRSALIWQRSRTQIISNSFVFETMWTKLIYNIMIYKMKSIANLS